jgi:GlpG protein
MLLRQIGTIPKETDPARFVDHLETLGVTSRAIDSKDGWAIWVHTEDKLPQAREEFAAYTANPDDVRFESAAETAKKVRLEKARLDREYRKNMRDLKGRWDRIEIRRRPLTVALMTISIGLYLVTSLFPAWRAPIEDTLGFFPRADRVANADVVRGLAAIQRGELWRIITPIFLHFHIWHIFFNMWALQQAGTVIEYRRGTKTLAVLVLLAAVASNVGQYIYSLNFERFTVPFGGMSGVVYALFGYIWMKGRVQPEDGLILHPNSVRLMLLWLLLGFTGFGQMANGAHVVGLIVGILFGIARF